MTPQEPPRDCGLCPRLAGFRARHRSAEPGWHNAPVPSFGPLDSRLLIVGLAPGLRGANRTGRPFTGDYAGDLLYATLLEFGFATGGYDRRADDGLTLVDCRVTNAVRCVPRLAVILALGTVAHASVVRALGRRVAGFKFAHGAMHALGGGLTLADSYHCSRYNLNTGRLTDEMFRSAFAIVRETLDRG